MSEITWRDATREDLPGIERAWDVHDAMLAEMAPTVKAPRPTLFSIAGQEVSGAWGIYQPPIIRVRVAERDGEIVACRIVEAVCEVQLIGGDQEVVKSLERELPEECHWAKGLGFRSGWGLVPSELMPAMARALKHTPLRPWPNLQLVGCDFSELGD